jgi:MFS transporter, AAHS family, 4-hydroxybenzoate transporter
MTEAVDVGRILDEQKTGFAHARIVLLCFLMLYLDGIDNLGIAYVAPALNEAWHLSRGALGPVFTAGVAGVAIGALVTGPIADRFGRRPTTIITVIYFSLLTLAVTQASNLTELMVLRFFAGLGLGSLVPMAVVIASEFAPRATRARMVTLASCGYAIGAASGGLIAAQIVPHYGWQGMFYLGGVLPLFLAAAMYVWLPESVRLQALRPGNDAEIARTLKTINPALSFPSNVTFTLAQEATADTPRVVQLFTDGRIAITILLWLVISLNTTVLNLLNQWLPTLINGTGLPQAVALRVASSLQFGGVIGVISMGMLADRYGFFRVLAIGFFVAGTFVGLIGSVGTSAFMLAATIGVAGFCVIGCQITDAALAAALYPTDIRSTAVNWAHGVARVLSTVGPLLGGILLEYDWPLRDIFFLFAVPLFVACGGILVLQSVVQAANKARHTESSAAQNAAA